MAIDKITTPPEAFGDVIDKVNEVIEEVNATDPSMLSGLSDVEITSPASGQVLSYDGTEWTNAGGYQTTANLVTSVSSQSTDAQYPSAKCVYDGLESKQTTANLVTSVSSQSTDTQYPSARCVYDGLESKQTTANLVTSISSQSTDTQYPSAKCVYDMMSAVKRMSLRGAKRRGNLL